jgi:heme/copper-type cytochrome/quinol oxidase subunit 2
MFLTVVFIILFLIMVTVLAVLTIGAWRAERRSNQRIRDIQAEGHWLQTKNRAATNKNTGAGFAGYHSPRSRCRD